MDLEERHEQAGQERDRHLERCVDSTGSNPLLLTLAFKELTIVQFRKGEAGGYRSGRAQSKLAHQSS